MTSTKTRSNNRLDLTSEEAAFIKKAIKTQSEQLEALTEWPAIIPYSKEYVIAAHATILTKIDDLSKPVAVKTRVRAPKDGTTVAAPTKQAVPGASARQANA
jgi:hypothetical protein